MHGEITHADHTRVMGTLVEPEIIDLSTYQYGQYAYLHPHAVEHSDLASREVMIEEVIDLEHVAVRYCNSEDVFTVPARHLSAPIWV